MTVQTIGKELYLMGILPCGTTLRECSHELFVSTLEWTGLAGVAIISATIGAQILVTRAENRSWARDIREQQQAISNRFQTTSAMLLLGGVLATALAIFKLTAAALLSITASTIIGGIWLGVGTAVVLNYIVHKRAFADDGRKAQLV